MTFKEMQDRVLGYVDNRPDLLPIVKAMINERADSLAMPFEFPTLRGTAELVTAANTAFIALDPTVYVIQSAQILNPFAPLEVGDYETFDLADPSVTGMPTTIIYGEGRAYFAPIPDGIYTIRYRFKRLPTPLEDDLEISELPRDWHPIVVKLAASELAFYVGMAQRGMELKNEALGEISGRQEVHTMTRRRQTGQVTPARRR